MGWRLSAASLLKHPPDEKDLVMHPPNALHNATIGIRGNRQAGCQALCIGAARSVTLYRVTLLSPHRNHRDRQARLCRSPIQTVRDALATTTATVATASGSSGRSRCRFGSSLWNCHKPLASLAALVAVLVFSFACSRCCRRTLTPLDVRAATLASSFEAVDGLRLLSL